MSEFTIYDSTTGEIRRVYDGSSPDAQLSAGEAYLAGRWPDSEHRVDIGQTPPAAVSKTSPPTTIDVVAIPADGVTAATVSGIPAGTLARAVGPGVNTKAVVGDGTFVLTFDVAGEYRLKLTHPLYLTQEYVIDAT